MALRRNPVDHVRLWHVAVTLSGDPMEPLMLRAALQRFADQRPFMSSLRFTADRVEIKYWDEGQHLVDVGSLALRLWNEYRMEARLPAWEVVGLEVIDKELHRSREDLEQMSNLGVVPQPF